MGMFYIYFLISPAIIQVTILRTVLFKLENEDLME